jgi:hypothetical protein
MQSAIMKHNWLPLHNLMVVISMTRTRANALATSWK